MVSNCCNSWYDEVMEDVFDGYLRFGFKLRIRKGSIIFLFFFNFFDVLIFV